MKEKINRMGDLATELSCTVDSMSMIRYAMDSDDDVEPRAIIDSIYATEMHIERIANELERIVLTFEMGGGA